MTITGRTIGGGARRRARRRARRPGRDPPSTNRCTPGPPRDPPATSPRGGCVAKITGLRIRRSPARRACSTPSRKRWRRSWRTRSARRRDRDPLRGPKGGPGMQEMLAPTSALIGRPRRIGRPHHRRALLRRHVGYGRNTTSRRRRDAGAPSRSWHEGDSVTIDAHRLIQLNVDDAELARRRGVAPPAALHPRPAREVHAARVHASKGDHGRSDEVHDDAGRKRPALHRT